MIEIPVVQVNTYIIDGREIVDRDEDAESSPTHEITAYCIQCNYQESFPDVLSAPKWVRNLFDLAWKDEKKETEDGENNNGGQESTYEGEVSVKLTGLAAMRCGRQEGEPEKTAQETFLENPPVAKNGQEDDDPEHIEKVRDLERFSLAARWNELTNEQIETIIAIIDQYQ